MKMDLTNFKKLTDQLQKNIGKKAVRAGAKLIIASVKSSAPVDTGALKQSIGSKVDALRGSTVVFGIVGPKTKFKQGTKKPARYGHLAEAKHKYLERAWSSNKQRYITTTQDVIAKEMTALLQ